MNQTKTPTSKIKTFYIAICTIILMAASTTGVFAQEVDYANPKIYTIEGINVEGAENLNKSVLINISKLEQGEKIQIPGEKITDAIRRLWRQDMFSDVKILVAKIEDEKIYLTIKLKEQPRLSELIFDGTKKNEEDDIREQIPLARGGQVTENTLLHSKNIIKDYFAEKGYSNANVQIFKKRDSAFVNSAKVKIILNRGRKTRITDIIIDGNKTFTDRQIQWKMLKNTKRRRWWGLFKPSKYIASEYKADKKNLITEMNKNGYRDAVILQDSVYKVSPNRVKIYLKIDEGKQYFFRKIQWVGNKIYNTDLLNRQLQIERGDVYNTEKLKNRLNIDPDAVGNIYMDNGHLFFHVTPEVEAIDNDSVDITLKIYEGPKATINKIIIKGNSKTNDHVVRRELRTRPGDLFSKSDIIRSIRELAQLGHFDPERIVPVPIPKPENGTVDIEYNLEERPNDRVEVSAGWGRNMVVGSLGFSFNNFSIGNIFNKKSWDPLPTGDGQKLSIRMQTNGSRYQYYSLSFIEPWLGGKKPNTLSVSVYHNLQTNGFARNSARRRDAKIDGIVVGLGRRLKFPDDFFTLTHQLGYQRYDLNRWNFFQNITDGVFNKISLTTTIARNSLDAPIYTRKGSEFSLSLEVTPPYSLMNKKSYTDLPSDEKYRWIEYHKWIFRANWFSQLFHDLVLHTKTECGILGFYNKDYGYSPLGGFSLGGDGMGYYSYGTDIIGQRGYPNGSLTPDEGGNLYAKYTMELRYPIVLKESTSIYAMVYGEAGNAWSEFSNFNPFDVKRSLGVGVRIFLPMLGMLGFDWAYGFDNVPGQTTPAAGNFHFTMGQQF